MKKQVVFRLYLKLQTIYYISRTIYRKCKEIFDGWYNYIFRVDAIEKLAKIRLKECKDCAFFKFNGCTRCGCPSAGKIRSPSSYCLEGRWHSVNLENNNIPDVPMLKHSSSNELLKINNHN